MGFDTLLGNERLKDNLITSLRRGRHSHFYLISGPTGSGKHTLAKLLAAAILCGEGQKPCLRCNTCRKVLDGVHPDFITIEDPEHKNVAVKIIRQFRDDMFVLPNEAEYKIYLLAQDMGTEGQNALLKVLEEPPSYGVFLLLTDNPEKLLPTVRSRCIELQLLPLERGTMLRELQRRFPNADAQTIEAAISRSGGYLGQAIGLLSDGEAMPSQTEAVIRAVTTRDSLLLAQTLAPMEKWKRDQLLPVLQQWLEILEGALACRSGMQALSPLSSELATARSAVELRYAICAVQKAMEYAQGNVAVGAICGWLQHALR